MQTIKITITSPSESNIVLKKFKSKSNDINEKLRNLLFSKNKSDKKKVK